MDLREVADALYAVSPADFVAARAAAAAGADTDVAARIRRFRKPSAAAAAINALVRSDPDRVNAILEIGDSMRDAFAARDSSTIRTLTRERQRLLQYALHGLDTSATVQREIEDTLQAAVVDPAAAAAVRSGLLVRSLTSTGIDTIDLGDAVALPPDGILPPSRHLTSPSAQIDAEAGAEDARSSAARRERARQVRVAEKELSRARAQADALDDELDGTVDRRHDLEAKVEACERQLRHAESELSTSRAVEHELRRRVADAYTAIREAERAVRDAHTR